PASRSPRPGTGRAARAGSPGTPPGSCESWSRYSDAKKSAAVRVGSGCGPTAGQRVRYGNRDAGGERGRPPAARGIQGAGPAPRLGVGADELHGGKPELGHASISGFGQGRPTLAGYDQIAQGTSGLMSITGEPDGRPTKVGVPIADMAAGMFAAHCIMAALLE